MKKYLTYLDYAATGEGHTVELTVVQAKNKKEAVERHMKMFQYPNSCKNYFRRGIDAVIVTSERAEQLIKEHFKNDLQILSLLKNDCHFHFQYSYHVNCS